MHWVRIADAGWASRLLSTTFAPHQRQSVVRFAAKVVLVPHIAASGHRAVLGVERHPRASSVRRLVDGTLWALAPKSAPVRTGQLPRPIRKASEWRVTNLAAAPTAGPGAAVALARTIVALADRHQASLVVDVGDPAHLAAYLRYGFERDEGVPHRVVRSPQPLVQR